MKKRYSYRSTLQFIVSVGAMMFASCSSEDWNVAEEIQKEEDAVAERPGLAVYGVKDNAINTANTAYGAMIFMVSTKDPASMQTHNKAYFNIGSGDLVIAK